MENSDKCQALFKVSRPDQVQPFFDALSKAGANITLIEIGVDYTLAGKVAAALAQIPDIEKEQPAATTGPAQDQAAPPPTNRKEKGAKKEKVEKKTYTFGRKDKPELAEAIARGFDVLGFIRIPDTPDGWVYLSTKDPKSHKTAVYRVVAGKRSEGIAPDLLAQLEKSYPAVFDKARKAGLQVGLPRADLKGGTCQIGLHASGELGSCDAMRAPHCKKHHDESHGDLLHPFVAQSQTIKATAV